MRKLPHKSGGSYAYDDWRARRAGTPSGVQSGVRGLKLKVFCLSDVQMRRKFVNFVILCKLRKCNFLKKNIVAFLFGHVIGRYTVAKSEEGGLEAIAA